MRRVLLPGLLRNAAYNLNRGQQDIRLFEWGKVFLPAHEGAPAERISLGGVGIGHRFPESWSHPKSPLDVFDLKGVLEGLFKLFPGRKVDFVPLEALPERKGHWPFLHPGQGVEVQISDGQASKASSLGWMGTLHPRIAERFEIQEAVFAFELDLEPLLEPPAQARRPFSPPSAFPEVRRDLAIIVPQEMPAKLISDLIFSIKSKVIDRVELFDVYSGEPIPKEKKSLAYAIHYLSRERTLTSEEVDRIHDKVLEKLVSELGAQVRS
jgi:phenylalanyl-tRNA synthetase beta chain